MSWDRVYRLGVRVQFARSRLEDGRKSAIDGYEENSAAGLTGARASQRCTLGGRPSHLFLERQHFEHLCEQTDAQRAVLSELGNRVPPPLTMADTGRVIYLHCPLCKDVMSRRNFGGTEIDLAGVITWV